MPRLKPAEVRAFEDELRQPLSSAAFSGLVDKLTEALGHWALVQNSPFRDAYVAKLFAELRGARTVRLGHDPPDFHLTGVSGCDTFEVVETYQRDRRRSDEYRQLAMADEKRRVRGDEALNAAEKSLFAADPDPFEAWEARARTATALLKAAAQSKSKRGYPRDWGLVIYLDLGGFVHSDEAVWAQVTRGTASAKTAFQEVWVLWDRSTRLVWRDGQNVRSFRSL